MNDHLKRVLEEEQRNRSQSKKMNRMSLIVVVLVIAGAFFVGGRSDKAEPEASPQPEVASSQVSAPSPVATPTAAPSPGPWQLLIVNRSQKLPKDYQVTLTEVGTEKVDERIAGPLKDMMAAAAENGVELRVCSGYRSVKDQSDLYEKKIKEWMDKGLKEEASVIETQKYLQPPGASEHHTGLAVDFLQLGGTSLDTGFAETADYQWLKAHAAEFGFIERYPKEKEGQTGVLWEPWHYRYVGEYADEIGTRCLEEYIEKTDKNG